LITGALALSTPFESDVRLDMIECKGNGENVTAQILLENEMPYDLLIRPTISSFDLTWQQEESGKWVEHYLSLEQNLEFDMSSNKDFILEKGKTFLLDIKAHARLPTGWIESHRATGIQCEVNLDWEDRFGHQVFLAANGKNALTYVDVGE
jgi:hypothetical protein